MKNLLLILCLAMCVSVHAAMHDTDDVTGSITFRFRTWSKPNDTMALLFQAGNTKISRRMEIPDYTDAALSTHGIRVYIKNINDGTRVRAPDDALVAVEQFGSRPPKWALFTPTGRAKTLDIYPADLDRMFGPGVDGTACLEYEDANGVPVSFDTPSCLTRQATGACAASVDSTIRIEPQMHNNNFVGTGSTNLNIRCTRAVDSTIEIKQIAGTGEIPDDPTLEPLTISSPSWDWGTNKRITNVVVPIHADYSSSTPTPGEHTWIYLITATYN